QLDLDKLLRILPSQRNTEELLRRIRSLTEQGDFNLMRFTPQAEQPLDFYTEWPIKVELEGTYHNLALFFDRIGRFRRIINVDQLDIAALKNNNRDERSAYTIRARFTAKTFLYNEPFDEEEGE
ncbi:MAG: type 4a pilus biogenesis protein PilO, partial [Acidobacteriota bacterium]